MLCAPNGVHRMSPTLQGVVETSCNFGVIRLHEENDSMSFSGCLLVRSLVDSQTEYLANVAKAPFALIGCEVLLENGYPGWKPEPESTLLKQFDAVVVGIRAYNTVSALKFKQKFLLDYVEKGGNMIVQYNTSGRRGVDVGAPYKLEISRDRVTDESAKVTILAKDHSLMNFPNKITSNDFNGWVQERGLYFPNKWGKEFTPVLSMNDEGETVKNGSILVAKHGKGYYMYTGLSFFRELPAGVSGAYKIFANMLSIGKDNLQIKQEIKE